jgi:hypothetical protein
MKPHNYSHLFFDKGVKNTWWRNRQPLQQILLGKLDICIQKTETRSIFHCYKLSTQSGLKT